MSTLAEIEAAVARLDHAELERLERHVHELALARRGSAKVFTGSQAASWWREREHLPSEEAEAFADDIEAAHAAMNQTPSERPWR